MPTGSRLPEAYAENIAREFGVISGHLSLLVRHRGEIGRYRESILTEFLREKLYPGFLVLSGFFKTPDRSSHQHDILIVDQKRAPLVFFRGAVAVVEPVSVGVAIEVKTGLGKKEFLGIVAKSGDARSCTRECTGSGQPILTVGYALPVWREGVEEAERDLSGDGLQRMLSALTKEVESWPANKRQELRRGIPDVVCAGQHHVLRRRGSSAMELYRFDRDIAVEALFGCVAARLYDLVIDAPLLKRDDAELVGHYDF